VASEASRVGDQRTDPHPTTYASLREANVVDLPLAGGGIAAFLASLITMRYGAAQCATLIAPYGSVNTISWLVTPPAPGFKEPPAR
jgi:hypothetical protein